MLTTRTYLMYSESTVTRNTPSVEAAALELHHATTNAKYSDKLDTEEGVTLNRYIERRVQKE